MRIFTAVLYLVGVVFALLLFFYIYGFVFSTFEDITDSVLRNASQTHNVSIDFRRYDIKSPLALLIEGLNYVLIVAFLAAVLGIFLWVRRRD